MLVQEYVQGEEEAAVREAEEISDVKGNVYDDVPFDDSTLATS